MVSKYRIQGNSSDGREKATKMMFSGMLREPSGEFAALSLHLQAKLQKLLLDWFSGLHWPPQLMYRLIRHDVGNGEWGVKWGMSNL